MSLRLFNTITITTTTTTTNNNNNNNNDNNNNNNTAMMTHRFACYHVHIPVLFIYCITARVLQDDNGIGDDDDDGGGGGGDGQSANGMETVYCGG
ncbi:unnamed protein product [Schistosoma margrebowiei]|uniref:Uncharacterized protein n=1 Tax=Schistosoma margrebowiei TaxID=48269 RepID=A0A183MPW1_9TREM|nr:unnamed protein product [Schistosoma margrebowiei]